MPRPHEAVSAPPPSRGTVSPSTDDFPGNVFLTPDFVRHYRGPWCWPFPQPPMAPGDLRASLLRGVEYLDGALDSQIDADAAALLNNLEVLHGLVAVVIAQLRTPSSSENRTLQ
jgi:hypothetical protein